MADLRVERGYEPRHVGSLCKLEKYKETEAPPEPPEGAQPSQYLDFSPRDPFQTPDFQNCKIINFCVEVTTHVVPCMVAIGNNTLILLNTQSLLL